jgi:hypothetical protein
MRRERSFHYISAFLQDVFVNTTTRSLDTHLEAALEAATDESARYHIRQALQLRLVETECEEDELSVR